MTLYPEFQDGVQNGVQNGRLNLKNSNKSSNIHPNDMIFMSIPGFRVFRVMEPNNKTNEN